MAEVAFGALHGIVPITLFTTNAVRNIRPVFIKTARSSVRSWDLARTILSRQRCLRSSPACALVRVTLIGTLISEISGRNAAWIPADERARRQ